MHRAIEVVPMGLWPWARRVGRATLDFDHRLRRRIRLATDEGLAFLLDLPEARLMRAGDGLILDNGDVVEIAAADEAVCDVAGETPEALARLAWHLGNRHLAVEIIPGGLRIRDDHVIVAMLLGLGAQVTRRSASFTPEPGAYATHGHHHGHDHDHRHA